MLDRVGLLDSGALVKSQLERGPVAFHYRRAMAPREIEMLDKEWCAVLPVDRAGAGIILERNT